MSAGLQIPQCDLLSLSRRPKNVFPRGVEGIFVLEAIFLASFEGHLFWLEAKWVALKARQKNCRAFLTCPLT